MALIEDDAEINPEIPPLQLSYIRQLSDTHKQYTRFFDALLIPRPSHSAFFRDLIEFRVLPTTIQALILCNPEDESISKEQRTENYRNVTRKYLGSRFAHPWCRKAMAGMGNTTIGGWSGAEWTATGRRLSKEQRAQEDKLHKLLVPVWICFRSRMFPGSLAIEEWWEQWKLKPQVTIVEPHSPRTASVVETSHDTSLAYPELGFAKSSPNLKDTSTEHIDNGEEEAEEMRRHADTAATGLLRLAAAGMIVSSMPKMQKWKLKRELKKQGRRL